MNYITHKVNSKKYLEVKDNSFVLESEQDALDLAALCSENDTDTFLLDLENLDHRFYDLRTGLAGAVLQKLSNYRVKMAVIVPTDVIKGRFGELALELNRGKQFGIFSSREDAENWLSG